MARERPSLTILLIVGLLLQFYGCDSPTGESVKDAIKQLAPEGGSGVKRYYYESGELKEETHWKQYEVVKIVYYLKMGEPFFTCVPNEKRTLQVTLNDNGEITEAFQSIDFIKDGHCLVFENGVVRRVQRLKHGEVISEVVLPRKFRGHNTDIDKLGEIQ